ncbi:MAG: alpha/beta fold hydrolase [Rhodoferax sp.]|nr:alpha/beta fold hydrolase [Rhodoferax sp.]
MWQAQLPAMPAHLSACVSDVHVRCDALPAMADALLDDHDGDLILCGASMGGMLAMEAARQAPQRVRGLALLGTSARPEDEATRALREAAIVLFEQGRMDEVLQANLPLAFDSSRAADAALHQAYLAMIGRAGAQQLIAQNRAVISRPDALAHIGRLRCPVLVLCGEGDALTPPDRSREIASAIPGAELVLLPRCGHMLTLEQPDAVNAHLLRWLARVAPG